MDAPRDVVPDGEVVEHIPDEHADVVVAQERQTGDVQARTLLSPRPERPAVGSVGVRGLPGLPAGVDADGVPRLQGHPVRRQDVLELPAVHGRLLGHAGDPPMARDVQHHAARDDAVGPVLDRPERRPVEGDLLPRVAPVPHRLVVPRVAQRVDVRGGHAVVEDAVVVRGEAARPPRERPHVVLGRDRVVRTRFLGEGPAQRNRPARADEARRRRPLGRRDEVDRADLVVGAPPPPVPPVANRGAHFLRRR